MADIDAPPGGGLKQPHRRPKGHQGLGEGPRRTRGQAMLDNSGARAITPQMVCTFTKTARQRLCHEGG